MLKYGKLRTKDGHIISSKWISQNRIKSRNNYSVAVCIIVFSIIYLINIIILIVNPFSIRLTSLLIRMLIVLMFLEDLKKKKYMAKYNISLYMNIMDQNVYLHMSAKLIITLRTIADSYISVNSVVFNLLKL